MIKDNNGKLLKGITLTFSFVWLIVIHFLNEIPFDVGDGIMHFNISQASWSDSQLFIHHWGKPLFILLSSTFAQLGFSGIVFFNILIFIITVFFAWKISSNLEIPPLFQAAYPLVLISIFDYSSCILSGLTEPLFSLFIMIAFWLILSKKWFWFAFIISFMPFIRSEGQLPILIAFLLLSILGKWKSIPFLLTGFIIYGILGIFLIGDFWWYFTNSPYEWSNDIYGSGNWYDYLKSYKQYLGNTGLILTITGSISIVYLIRNKKWEDLHFFSLIFVSGVFLGILFIHSYFWTNGLSGSLGLTRIATQGMPSFILLSIYYTSKVEVKSRFKELRLLLFLLFIIIIPFSVLTSSHFPKKINGLEKEVLKASKFLRQKDFQGKKFFFHNPLFAYQMGANPYLNNQSYIFYYCNGLENDLGNIIKPGDYIVRDSQFGPQEAKMDLNDFETSPEIIKIKSFYSNRKGLTSFNEKEGVVIYQYQTTKDKFVKQLGDEKSIEFEKGREFRSIDYLIDMPINNKEITFQAESNSDSLHFVLDQNNGETYKSIPLKKDSIITFKVNVRQLKSTKLYFWNQTKNSVLVKWKIINIAN